MAINIFATDSFYFEAEAAAGHSSNGHFVSQSAPTPKIHFAVLWAHTVCCALITKTNVVLEMMVQLMTRTFHQFIHDATMRTGWAQSGRSNGRVMKKAVIHIHRITFGVVVNAYRISTLNWRSRPYFHTILLVSLEQRVEFVCLFVSKYHPHTRFILCVFRMFLRQFPCAT